MAYAQLVKYVKRNPMTAGKIAGAAYNLYRMGKGARVASRALTVRPRYKRKRKTAKKGSKLARGTVKTVKEIVKRELSKEDPTGTYYKNYAGTLLLPGPGTNSQIAGDHVFWTEGQIQKQRLAFFTPAQIVDAASILFNSKTAAIPDTGTSGNFGTVSLKFNIVYASATVTLRNFFTGIIDIHLYEVTAKHMEPDWFGDDYTDSLEASNMQQVGGVTFNRSSLNVKPTQVSELKTRYAIKTVTKRLQPGESFTHFMSMKANTQFNYQDNIDGNAACFVNKYSKQLFYTYSPVLSPIFDAVDSRLKVGRAYRTVASSTTSLGCITCEVKEFYKMDPPTGITISNARDTVCVLNAYEAVGSATGVSQITKDYVNTNSTFVADL